MNWIHDRPRSSAIALFISLALLLVVALFATRGPQKSMYVMGFSTNHQLTATNHQPPSTVDSA